MNENTRIRVSGAEINIEIITTIVELLNEFRQMDVENRLEIQTRLVEKAEGDVRAFYEKVFDSVNSVLEM